MNTKVRLYLFTLGLPVIAGAMAWACIAKVDSNLRDRLEEKYPTMTQSELSQTTVASLAAEGRFGPGSELPAIYTNLKFARLTAGITGVLGLGLIGGIYYAGHRTRNRRDLLLRLFRPGLFVTLASVGVLTAAQSIAAAYALYYFESIFIERVHFILIFGVAIGGVLALVAVIRAMFSLKHSSVFNVRGHNATEEEQPELWKIIHEVCSELKASAPDNLILGLEPTFYVTESDVLTSNGKLTGRTLFVSLSLCRLLSANELRSIIGHEMAHFIGEDTIFSQRFFPVYRGTLVALHHLSRNAIHSSVAIAQMPAVTFLAFFYQSFVESEKNLSRQREIEADAVGARIGGATSLATGLVKVHAYVGGWKDILEEVRFNAEALRSETNLSVPFYARASALSPDEMVRAGNNHVAHPTDSHPTLAARLQSLRTDMSAVLPLTVIPAFDKSAAALVTDRENLEAEQSADLRKSIRPV